MSNEEERQPWADRPEAEPGTDRDGFLRDLKRASRDWQPEKKKPNAKPAKGTRKT